MILFFFMMVFESQHSKTHSGDPHCSLPYLLSESGQVTNKKYKWGGAGGRGADLGG